MKKISTLFKKDPNNLGRVINEINPENAWALTNGVATRKYDGTTCAIINGEIYKRYDIKKGRSVPEGAIPCQDADPITGHWPHWVKCDRANPADKWHFEAFDRGRISDGTYELCGPNIQGNPEKLERNSLVRHGNWQFIEFDYSFEAVKKFLAEHDIEGVVIHEIGGNRMCKIRKSDFGLKR